MYASLILSTLLQVVPRLRTTENNLNFLQGEKTLESTQVNASRLGVSVFNTVIAFAQVPASFLSTTQEHKTVIKMFRMKVGT